MRPFLFVTLVAATAAFAADPCVSPTGRQVSVDGSASIAMRPDRVSFSVGVETTAPNVGDAFNRNSAKANAIIAALKARGIPPASIQTSNFSIDDTGRAKTGFRVTNRVTVTLEDPSTIGELLQLAVSNGANEAGNVNFFIDDPGKHTARGLELAFRNAREKAEKLAALSGRALGDVVCVSDSSSYGGGGGRFENITVTANAPQIALGQESLSFGVSVVFELK